MAYEYGIEICNDVLTYISQNRFDHAVSEIEVMEPEDVSESHFSEIRELLIKYYSHSDLMVADTGVLNEATSPVRLQDRLEDLCYRIITYNKEGLVTQQTA
ncbi:hypothetical protein [Niabella ginsengisoli]|uniref:Uncharacterized protein n=1 Tax=Niabella ginsengisoli TaxID=522298 RepID=A0ABS9SN53_9BACT|nr:hypothetical protein [Niabella ginsengisoli]MCH5599805.1 hypothetical protein [Niabella ginsengisoli]